MVVSLFFRTFAKKSIMRFYKEVWGFIFEFNSVGEYIDFLIGRLYGIIILGVIFYWLFLK